MAKMLFNIQLTSQRDPEMFDSSDAGLRLA